MLAVAFFYFKSEQRLMFDLSKSNMQNIASKISSRIIFAHMTNSKFNTAELTSYPTYSIALYDNQQKKILGEINEKIDFNPIIKEEGTIFNNAIKPYGKSYILVDTSTFGHLGVHYIAIKETTFNDKITQLKIDILLFFIAIYALISLIGFFLAKLLIQPISLQRHKINNFIKDTTHELNTPITGLLMCTEQKGEMSEKNAERIRLSARRISDIYKDLTYLFLQDNHQEQPKEKLALHELLQEQIEYLAPIAQKKRINFKLNIKPTFFTMNKEDFIRLSTNLISNAIKYNKIAGSIEISLHDNQLIIKDSGIGIKDIKQNDIFKRYYRATKTQGGFGIGLSIVKHICQTYGIKIYVNSKEQVGTTFTLNF